MDKGPGQHVRGPQRVTNLARPQPGADSHLFESLRARVCEDGGAASARGDSPAERFSRPSLAILNSMRRKLAEEPRHANEVAQLLYRMAAPYIGQPDYRRFWTLFSAP